MPSLNALTPNQERLIQPDPNLPQPLDTDPLFEEPSTAPENRPPIFSWGQKLGCWDFWVLGLDWGKNPVSWVEASFPKLGQDGSTGVRLPLKIEDDR